MCYVCLACTPGIPESKFCRKAGSAKIGCDFTVTFKRFPLSWLFTQEFQTNNIPLLRGTFSPSRDKYRGRPKDCIEVSWQFEIADLFNFLKVLFLLTDTLKLLFSAKLTHQITLQQFLIDWYFSLPYYVGNLIQFLILLRKTTLNFIICHLNLFCGFSSTRKQYAFDGLMYSFCLVFLPEWEITELPMDLRGF